MINYSMLPTASGVGVGPLGVEPGPIAVTPAECVGWLVLSLNGESTSVIVAYTAFSF